MKQVLSFALTPAIYVVAALATFATPQKQAENSSSLCSRDNALQTIRQQIDFTRTFDDQVRRITVLLRAADMLWLYQQDNSRAAFTEAFDLARQNFKDKGDEPIQQGHLIVSVPDQRYAVITAIAKRDPKWAGRLSDQLLEEETTEGNEKSTKDSKQDARTAEKLLGTALTLLPSDEGAAVHFARSSLRYPATLLLQMFLYKLAARNRPAADVFYQEALVAYANARMERFLYLSAYPFGNHGDAGEMPMTSAYDVPKDFVPAVGLQRLFVQTLLRRAQEAVESPSNPSTDYRLSDSQQIWLAFMRLESQIEKALPDLIVPVRQAKGSVFTLLNQKEQRLDRTAGNDSDPFSFDKMLERADKQKDPAIRDGLLAMAVFSGARSDKPFEQIVDMIEKISDQDIRGKLLNWVYFERAQKATEEQNLAEAKRFRNDTEARELLEEVVTAAAKAPDTVVKARALLGVAYLYTKVEPNRSVSVLSDAVQSINRIDSPDFSSEDAGRRIESKGFGAYATMKTPGFNPENGFREIGKYDFDGTMYLAGTFANKPLRAMTTLALVEECLKAGVQQEKPEKAKPKKKP